MCSTRRSWCTEVRHTSGVRNGAPCGAPIPRPPSPRGRRGPCRACALALAQRAVSRRSTNGRTDEAVALAHRTTRVVRSRSPAPGAAWTAHGHEGAARRQGHVTAARRSCRGGGGAQRHLGRVARRRAVALGRQQAGSTTAPPPKGWPLEALVVVVVLQHNAVCGRAVHGSHQRPQRRCGGRVGGRGRRLGLAAEHCVHPRGPRGARGRRWGRRRGGAVAAVAITITIVSGGGGRLQHGTGRGSGRRRVGWRGVRPGPVGMRVRIATPAEKRVVRDAGMVVASVGIAAGVGVGVGIAVRLGVGTAVIIIIIVFVVVVVVTMRVGPHRPPTVAPLGLHRRASDITHRGGHTTDHCVEPIGLRRWRRHWRWRWWRWGRGRQSVGSTA